MPRKEGKISVNAYSPLREWVPDGYKKVLLLDNDLALAPRAVHDQTLKDAKDIGLKLSITQGYDIREIYKDPTRAYDLADNKPYSLTFKERMLYFSWDLPQYEKMVLAGIKHLMDAGFRPAQMTCYVLVGYNTTFDQDIHRVNTLRELGVLSYVMPYNNRKDSQDINDLRRWANKRQLYKSMPFEKYNRHFRIRAKTTKVK
ncbi:MAG: hypothetical protein QXR73_02975 [Candidatus Micrarchaeaceae archaeon]